MNIAERANAILAQAMEWTPLFSIDVYDTANIAHNDAAGRRIHFIAC